MSSSPRFFVDAVLADVPPGEPVALPSPVAHHAVRVLRLKAGDAVVLFDGAGGEYEATLDQVERREASARLLRHVAVERESPLELTLVQSLLAADAMDYAVRKAVELGVKAIAPVVAARSQRAGATEHSDKRRAHWQSIAIAACEQCGRNRVPPVAAPRTLEGFLHDMAGAGPMAIAGPGASVSLAALAREAPPQFLIVGPEGGFTDDEVSAATTAGWLAVGLGQRILRVETAAIALASVAILSAEANG